MKQRHNLLSNPSVALPTSQLILQTFRCFTHVTDNSSTLISLLLRHRLLTYVTWRAAHDLVFHQVHHDVGRGLGLRRNCVQVVGRRTRSRTHYPSREESFPVRFQIEGSVSYPCIFQTSLCHLNKVRLRYRVPALKERMTDDHRLFHLAFAEENVN